VNKTLQSHAAMLCFSVLIAGSFSFGSMIANDISPIALTAVRFGLAACIIGLVAFFTRKITKSAMQSSWRYFILGGTFSLYFVLMFEGLRSAYSNFCSCSVYSDASDVQFFGIYYFKTEN
jgi:drug/metabolite transporter (DMT)-like permease